jgi:aryl-alcohol dehydrogenase-like predicted oxidoreductase
MQNHYNLIYREEEREMIPLCLDQGIGVIPWSPLARGVLAGNVSRSGQRHTIRARTDTFPDGAYDQPDDVDVIDHLSAVAARRGVPDAQVALAWLLHKPSVVAPIIGATKIQHINDAVAATSLALDGDEIASLEAPYRPHPIHGH